MLKVCLTRRWPEAVEQRFQRAFETTLNTSDAPMSAEALHAALRTHDVVCPTVSDRISAAVIGEGPLRARLLANYGVGFNHIDLDACRAAGLGVTNTPGVLTDATAEIAITLMLMAARRAGEGERELRTGEWRGWRPTHLIGAGVTGKTLGLLGFGRIGQAVARRARQGFDMRVCYHSRRRASPEVEAATGAEWRSTVEEVLSEADFVSLHTPGGAETRGLIDARRLAAMKPTAFLINTARGDVVDEAALASALGKGVIAGAGLDVYVEEPRVHADLLKLENVVLLPHLGSATRETREAMGLKAFENVEAFAGGRTPPDLVLAGT
jgi:lactate dehydrogenase-like 2-hydroxyacid dehydrogenase